MHKDNHHSPLAITYAQSLFELATEQNLPLEDIAKELRDIRQLLDSQASSRALLSDPSIGNEERSRFIKTAFEGRVSPLMYRFLSVLNVKGRLPMFPAISGAFDELLDEKLGKVEVDVTSAIRLGDQTLEEVRRRVSDALKRDAVVHQYVDESIIGGLILRVQDQLIDGSVRTQLAQMRQRILAAAPRGV